VHERIDPVADRIASGHGPARRVGPLALVLALMVPLVAACGAPASQALEGPVADEVRTARESGSASFDHDRWDRLLSEGTEDGLVDYVYFQRHRSELDAYLERIARLDLSSLAPGHLKALLINAYNAYTVETILDHPDVSSIRDIDGVWTERTHPVGGYDLTLDQIEHNVLRPFFRDPRIHFAVNCASMSCAPLTTWAVTGDSVDAQLDRMTRSFLRDTANVRIEPREPGSEDRVLKLSKYFDWYASDFTSDDWSPRAETIPGFVARYSRPEVEEFVEARDGSPPVEYLDYDWSLNAAVPPDPELAGAGTSGNAGSSGQRATGGGSIHRASLLPEPRLPTAAAPAGPDPRQESRADGEEAGTGTGASEGWVASLRRWVDGFGPAAPVVYGLAYVLATVLFIPGSALTIGAGVAFGLLWGTVLVSVASVAGAAISFVLARYLLRGRLETSMQDGAELPLLGAERSQKMWRFVEVVDRALGRKGWKIVALTRLSPAFPFNVQNYAYGLTRVGFRGYVLASWIAMLPGTLLYVYLGSAGAQVAQSATGAVDWGRTALQVLGLAATLAVVVIAGRIATRAVKEAAEMEEAGEDDDAPAGETVDGDAGGLARSGGEGGTGAGAGRDAEAASG